MANKKKLFREKSIERISSPEDLNEYIKTSNPGVYLVLAAIIVFIIGAMIWAVLGHVDSVCDAWVEVNNNHAKIVMRYPEEDFPKSCVYVKVKNTVLEVSGEDLNKEPMEATEEVLDGLNASVVYKSGLKEGEWIMIFECETDLGNGVYDAEVVLESYAPISFILN